MSVLYPEKTFSPRVEASPGSRMLVQPAGSLTVYWVNDDSERGSDMVYCV